MRTFLPILITICVISCKPGKEEKSFPALNEPVADLYDSLLKPFYHGVASGDPLSDRIIIWTRVTPEDSLPEVTVKWEVSDNEDFNEIVRDGSLVTGPGRDYTVKVDVDSLESGKVYFYRFSALGSNSMTGRTKTSGTDPDSLTFAVVSCSNYEWGYFSAYGHIGKRDILDAVIHLGDYIYEYEPGGYGDTTIGRKHIPAKEIVSLEDYRTRYSQYRLDPDLRLVHARHPFIAIWDDHEIADNTYESGAHNHQEDEGPFDQRKKAAIQTYYEWMPVRENGGLYRSFNFGELADLFMLDERIEGRSKQLDSITDPNYQSDSRSMLGKEQLTWLQEQLSNSSSTWKIIGNQVIFTDLDKSSVSPDNPRNLDSWDGYPAEKREIASFILSENIGNILFITGDTHASWVFESEVVDVSENPIAVEFGTPSISSANYDEYSNLEEAKQSELNYKAKNKHLKYTNLVDHGYLLVSLTPETATGTFYYVEDLRKVNADITVGPRFQVEEGVSSISFP